MPMRFTQRFAKSEKLTDILQSITKTFDFMRFQLHKFRDLEQKSALIQPSANLVIRECT
jgi:hypothetical protein